MIKPAKLINNIKANIEPTTIKKAEKSDFAMGLPATTPSGVAICPRAT